MLSSHSILVFISFSSHFPSPFTQENILAYLHCHPHHSPTTLPPYYSYPKSSHPLLCLICSTPQLNSLLTPVSALPPLTSCLLILIASSQFPVVIASMVSVLPLSHSVLLLSTCSLRFHHHRFPIPLCHT